VKARFLPAAMSATALVGLMAAPAFAVTDLVANGGFEVAVVANPFAANTTTLNSWTVASGDIDHIGNYWQAHTGNQSIDLYGCSPSVLRQQMTTTPGANYVLSYWVAGNPDVQGLKSGAARVGTSAGGVDLANQIISFDSTGKTRAAMGWVNKTVAFQATGATTFLEFADTSASTCFGVALDDVSVTEAVVVAQFPTTTTVMYAVAGVAGAAALSLLLRRRRTNSLAH
jgi:choice-of-anchor C domain-containing protein